MQAGAKAAANPREVGAASGIVVTMLPEPQHVEQVVLGKDGLVESLPKGGIVILEVRLNRNLLARGRTS